MNESSTYTLFSCDYVPGTYSVLDTIARFFLVTELDIIYTLLLSIGKEI